MPRPLVVAEHLSVEALESHYRQARDPVARSQFQMVWLLAQGQSSAQVAEVTGYCREWVREVLRRYNAGGLEGLGDRRHGNPGKLPMLDDALCEALSEALHGPAPDGGLWDSAKARVWISEQLGRPVGQVQGWRWLRRLGWTPQSPRPHHAKGDVAAQEAFKKTSPPRSVPRSVPRSASR